MVTPLAKYKELDLFPAVIKELWTMSQTRHVDEPA